MAKILLLTPQIPYPPQQGTSLRNYHIILGLAERHQITLLSFREPEQTEAAEQINPLLELCHEVITVEAPVRSFRSRLLQLLKSRKPDIAFRLRSQAMRDALASQLERNTFDIIQIEGLEMAFTIDHVQATDSDFRLVFDSHNAEAAIQQRALSTDLSSPRRWLAAGYSWTQIARIRRYERKVCQSADLVTVVSDADRITLQSYLPFHAPRMVVVPNCIDVSRYSTNHVQDDGRTSEPTSSPHDGMRFDVVFSGKMDYRPNVDAVLWFARSIWPRILEKRPACSCAIVGQKPHPRLKWLHDVEGITLTGRVESVQPYLTGASVYVMPFRIGSGTRLKLIEAMASGSAIVSTAIGAEGYDVQDRRELYLAESAKEFASTVLHLLEDPNERNRLGERGIEFAQQYDWRRVIPILEAAYERFA